MIAPAIEQLILSKSSSFLISADHVATVMDTNLLSHAFLILTKVKYSKIPVLDRFGRLTGLLTMPMITEKMIMFDHFDATLLDQHQVAEVMETTFPKLVIKGNFEKELEQVLHLMVDYPFIPVVDDQGQFVGILTRKEMMKAFNFVAHDLENFYDVVKIKELT